MVRDWERDLKKFEKFLGRLELEKYRELRAIKTVEQDLPQDLLPLEIYYRYYWDRTDFKDFEEVFKIYWHEKLNPHIYNFIKKYFYGCSLQFVEEGFKARLYRIWVSLLTQFHFQYLWNASQEEKILSSPELDAMGIDGIVELNDLKVGIQIKKISYRREASSRRFTKRQQKFADVIVEIPYLVVDTEDLQNKVVSPRVKEKSRERYMALLQLFNKNFIKLDNGFVIFKGSYLEHVREVILKESISIKRGSKITYDEILPL